MKEKDILEVIGSIDEEMIIDAAPSETKKKRMPWGRIGTAVACTAFVLAGALVAAPHFDSGDPTQTTTDLTYMETSTEVALPFRFDSFKDPFGIYGFMYNPESGHHATYISERHMTIILDDNFSSYQSARVIDEEYIGEKINDVEVKGYWHHHADDTDTDIEYLRAEIYAIKNVDACAAVAVKYLDKGSANTTVHYYTFFNQDVEWSSIKELIALYGSEYFDINSSIGINDFVDGTVIDRTYNLSDNEIETLEEMLVACAGEKKTLTSEDFKIIVSKGTKQVRLCCDLPSAGISQIPMFITDGGYLLMTWYGEDIYFDIGKDKALSIINLIEKNGTDHAYDNETIVTETTKR